eukprot:Plantae.Rhodophyta-Purpureofilum_apyrenoidigerum.ctg4069.p1 GENE.Plantae.Rhodophyta-Purpureofilum_apyrenoidigerum.ctg4069~~Plantae.Rhodophyta-Purpureofilum_apyrenoidigerum.ctg4069.p1  ORF type:complete len:282 (+),score=43.74 Plantae.Rhodophyta-Purpureofilum_apyrenoidigerum.ctg4069:178-1023(+)
MDSGFCFLHTARLCDRSAEDQTVKYPDVVHAISELIRVEDHGVEFIVDAEIVAFDSSTQKILPFQQLQGRARKDVSIANVKITVCIFAFDILYLNRPLISETLEKRRRMLHENFDEKPGVFCFAKGKDTTDAEEIMQLLNESIKIGCEGLMVKALDGPSSTYEPANRSQNWLKVKKDYLEGLTDSLDLVPIGGYYGKGKRTGVFGAFLLACYNSETEEYAVWQEYRACSRRDVTQPCFVRPAHALISCPVRWSTVMTDFVQNRNRFHGGDASRAERALQKE